jgi:hypothetical protein
LIKSWSSVVFLLIVRLVVALRSAEHNCELFVCYIMIKKQK